jgi:predicted dehydrogenase
MKRRTFLHQAAATAAAGSFLAGANDTVRVAVLGVNGQGWQHVQGYQRQPNVQVATLCDPDRQVAAARAAEFEKAYGRRVKTETDLRRVFEDPSIDAVSIATPNHWHALATIWACQAGKDVYVEKPGSHNVFEGRKVIEAAAKYKRIVQHGVQLRSSPALREAVEKLRAGVIGKVYLCRALVYRWRPGIGHFPEEPPPPHLDYELWQGPAQLRPFSRRLVHYNWHWHWDYGNGEIGNQGIHQLDMAQWGLGVQLPRHVAAMGGKFLWNDDQQTPEILTALCSYPEQNKMIEIAVRHWCTPDEQGVGVGNVFLGSEGYMLIRHYTAYETYLGQKRERGPSAKAEGDHYANFLAAVRSRKPSEQNGPAETAHYASALAHLSNISFRLGRRLQFDPARERFIGDAEADRLLSRDYRPPFVVPDKV